MPGIEDEDRLRQAVLRNHLACRRCGKVTDVDCIVGHASAPEVTTEMKKRVVEYWTNIHKDLGQGVAQGLGIASE